jgi:large subunit ribosomal protein L31
MKQGIHPNYNRITITCTTCGNEFEGGSVKNAIRVDTCSACHPFYTGRQKFAQADGRIERFNKKYGMATKSE